MKEKFNDIEHKLRETEQEVLILKDLNKLLQLQINDITNYDLGKDDSIQATIIREREQENILLKEFLNIVGLEETKQQKIIDLLLDEIRTPLTPIRAYAELLYSKKIGKLNEEQKTKLKIILKYSTRLEKILLNSLDLRRLEKNQLVLNLMQCDIVDLIKKAVSEMKKEGDYSNTEFIIDNKKRIVNCDPIRIKYAIWNLLELGLPTIGTAKSIIIKIFNEKQFTIIEINDLMLKTDTETMDYFWVNPTISATELRSEVWELYVCQKIIEHHGGILRLKKITGGMMIQFSLPDATTQDQLYTQLRD